MGSAHTPLNDLSPAYLSRYSNSPRVACLYELCFLSWEYPSQRSHPTCPFNTIYQNYNLFVLKDVIILLPSLSFTALLTTSTAPCVYIYHSLLLFSICLFSYLLHPLKIKFFEVIIFDLHTLGP